MPHGRFQESWDSEKMAWRPMHGWPWNTDRPSVRRATASALPPWEGRPGMAADAGNSFGIYTPLALDPRHDDAAHEIALSKEV